MENNDVTVHESTTANADLWTRYFHDQWSQWLNPFGTPAATPVSEMAEGTAARVAGFLTLVAAGPIAWLYSANSPRVTEIREELTAARIANDDADDDEESAA